MRITKYPQSCFTFEKNGKKLLIDLGFHYIDRYPPEKFLDISALLTTHIHRDHFHKEGLKAFKKNKIPMYGNSDVAEKSREAGVEIIEVEDRKTFTIAEFEITPIFLPHCKLNFCKKCNTMIKPPNYADTPERRCKIHPTEIPEQIDGPQNTGFLIDNIFFHPGDGYMIKNFTSPNVAIPIAGPTVYYKDVWEFSKNLKPKVIIPMHYDNGSVSKEFQDVNKFLEEKPKDVNPTVVVLKDEESMVIE